MARDDPPICQAVLGLSGTGIVPRLHYVYIQGKAAFSHKFLKHRPKGQPGSFPFHRTNTTDKPIALTILKKVATLGMVIPFSILDI